MGEGALYQTQINRNALTKLRWIPLVRVNYEIGELGSQLSKHPRFAYRTVTQ